MPKAFNLSTESISCHTFDRDFKHLAVSCSSAVIQIYSITGNPSNIASLNFALLTELKHHTMQVTGLDWSKGGSNQIVSCSADRNAYVWKQEGSSGETQWSRMYVNLGLSRAATCIQWSPQENKFAVGSGFRSVMVCYYDKEQDWWISKVIKKPISSTITSLDWHPENKLLACGCADFKVRIFNAVVKAAGDSKPRPSEWGSETAFGSMLFEASSNGYGAARGGWIHHVAFSPDGKSLAWVGHDSTVCLATAQGAENPPTVVVVRTEWLPFLGLLWLSPQSIVCAGYDCEPCLLSVTAQGCLTVKGPLDKQKKQGGDSTNDGGGGGSAMAKFMNMDAFNMEGVRQGLSSLHQNAVNQLCVFQGQPNGGGGVKVFSSIGRDGKMVFWDCGL